MDLWVIASKLCINYSKSGLYYSPDIVQYFLMHFFFLHDAAECYIAVDPIKRKLTVVDRSVRT